MDDISQDLTGKSDISRHEDPQMEEEETLSNSFANATNEAEDNSNSIPEISITVHHHGQAIPLSFPSTATLTDLSTHIHETLAVPASNQKFLISPKIGLVKPPFNPDHQLSTLTTKKIVFMGSTPTEISALSNTISSATASSRRRHHHAGPIKAAQPARTRNSRKIQDEAQYTFHSLRPLAYLPDPAASLRFLERLRDDAGIRTAMTKYKFSVPLLTEMDPAVHTTHESKTLGLNRNKGEVIELRLRTDDDDGYRDYKTIRKTLCHELAHNVWGEHDRNFWKLCREIEGIVERGDWTRGGRALGNEVYYEGPTSEEDYADAGGWTGGEFVLGGVGGSSSRSGSESTSLTRREILAKAAEERVKKSKASKRDGAGDAS